MATHNRKPRSKMKPAESAGPKKARAPKWATSYLEASMNAQAKLFQIARLSEQGINMHVGRPGALRALMGVGDLLKGESKLTQADVERAESDAALARREIDQDFPVLHGLVTIAIWSWLEDLVKGLVALWFLYRPASTNAAAVHRLRVRLGDYIRLSKADQAQFLVDLLEQELASPLKRGLPRFNSLLEVIGLSVSLSDDAARGLYELQSVRNNLAHRNGRVDARLRTACPWLKLKIGAELRVGDRMLARYSNAAGEFLVELIYAVGAAYGVGRKPEHSQSASSGARSKGQGRQTDARA